MTKRFYRKRSVLDKLTALLVVTAMFLTSSPVIALDTLRAAEQLSEQTFTLTPEDGVTVTLSGLMPVRGYAEAQPADVAGEDVLLRAAACMRAVSIAFPTRQVRW